MIIIDLILTTLLIAAIAACIVLYARLKNAEELAFMDLKIDSIYITSGKCKAYIIEQCSPIIPSDNMSSIDVWLEYENGRALCKSFGYKSDDNDDYIYASHCAEELADMINAKY